MPMDTHPNPHPIPNPNPISKAENMPMDMLGYSASTSTMSYNNKYDSALDTTVNNAPCAEDDDECYETMMRLTYLNQQSDGGALNLRRR